MPNLTDLADLINKIHASFGEVDIYIRLMHSGWPERGFNSEAFFFFLMKHPETFMCKQL